MEKFEEDLILERETLEFLFRIMRAFSKSVRKVAKLREASLDPNLVFALAACVKLVEQVMAKGIEFDDGDFTEGVKQHLEKVNTDIALLQVGKPTKEPTNQKKKGGESDGETK